MSEFETSPHGFDRASFGLQGFVQVVGPASTTEKIVAIKAMTGDVAFGADCQVERGDAPAEDMTLSQGDVLYGPFTKVDIKLGTVYCYKL